MIEDFIGGSGTNSDASGECCNPDNGIQTYVRALPQDEKKAMRELFIVRDRLKMGWDKMQALYCSKLTEPSLFTGMQSAMQADVDRIVVLQKLEAKYGDIRHYFANGNGKK